LRPRINSTEATKYPILMSADIPFNIPIRISF
jgi:hypothetical protein